MSVCLSHFLTNIDTAEVLLIMHKGIIQNTKCSSLMQGIGCSIAQILFFTFFRTLAMDFVIFQINFPYDFNGSTDPSNDKALAMMQGFLFCG